jgi:carbamoyl-phosphate synthase large subunit
VSTTWLLSTIGKRGYIAQYLRHADPLARIIGTGNAAFTPGFAACDRSFLMPDIGHADYIPAILDLIERERVEAILTFSDPDVMALATHRDAFLARSVRCYFPTRTVAHNCFDKLATAQWASDCGIRAPRTFLDPQEAAAAVGFPLIRKPRFGSASVGMKVVPSSRKLLPPEGDQTEYIYQERIVGDEVNVELCADDHGHLMGLSCWRKLLSRHGETELAVTTRRQDLIDYGLHLASHLKLSGPCDIDIIDRNGELVLIEVNTRFGGGYPVSHLAGAGFLELLVRSQRGERPPLHTGFADNIYMMKSLHPFGGPVNTMSDLFRVQQRPD